MSLKTNSGYASAVEECKRLQRELEIAGTALEHESEHRLRLQEENVTLQRELEAVKSQLQCELTNYGAEIRLRQSLEWELEEARRLADVREQAVNDLEAELEAHATDRVNQRAEVADLRERAEGLERERQHAVDALQRCDEDREVLRERAERAESAAAVDHEQITTLTQERDAARKAMSEAHKIAAKLAENPSVACAWSGLVRICALMEDAYAPTAPADPKKVDHK